MCGSATNLPKNWRSTRNPLMDPRTGAMRRLRRDHGPPVVHGDPLLLVIDAVQQSGSAMITRRAWKLSVDHDGLSNLMINQDHARSLIYPAGRRALTFKLLGFLSVRRYRLRTGVPEQVAVVAAAGGADGDCCPGDE